MARPRLKDEIAVTEKAVHVCRSYYQNPSGALANCLTNQADQVRAAISKFRGSRARVKLRDLALRIEHDATRIMYKARQGRY